MALASGVRLGPYEIAGARMLWVEGRVVGYLSGAAGKDI